jgi:hydrogenase maturation protease
MANDLVPLVLVIGIGNSLRCDDGVGQHVAREIEAQYWPGVRCLAVTQLTPELAAEIARAQHVIFVDARAVHAGIGVEVLDIQAESDSSSMPSHHATPQGLLALTKAVYGNCPEAALVCVHSTDFGLGNNLSSVATKSAEIAVRLIGTQIKRHLRTPQMSPQ